MAGSRSAAMVDRKIRMTCHRYTAVVVATIALTSAARGAEPAVAPDTALARVRVVEARRTPVAAEVVLTGDIQAQAQVNVSFRTNGKVAERRVEVGDHVEADQVLAVLEPLTQRANLDNAKAALVSAEALLTQAKMGYERQKQLLAGGYTTRPSYDNAEQELRTTQAAVESAKAALGTAQEQFSYTELRAGVAGIVTSRSVEVGQVVQSGQTVLVLAQDGPARGRAVAGLAGGAVVALVPPGLRDDPAIGILGPAWMFAVVWSTDVVAYITGRTFGGPKLMPTVSPKKTWSGALGGLAAGTAAGIGLVALARGYGWSPLAATSLAVVGLVSAAASIFSQAGDLAESALKRRWGVKDSGRSIPGHGGVMDRLDGFAAVALLAGLYLLAHRMGAV